jgi:predicted short-subunit dehydrogenase-like oxidoreductase (DUF2520 family)
MAEKLRPLHVTLLGSGNVATHFGEALRAAGAEIQQVYSRKLVHARALAKQLDAKATDKLASVADADVYLIAVKDDALPGIVKRFKKQNGIVLHTSGGLSLDVLAQFPNRGVLYPLQTLSKSRKIDLADVPLCIEAGDHITLASLDEIAGAMSDHVYHLSSAQRQAAHLSAVFACNFTNQLYAIAEELLKEQKLPFDLLRPLILETAAKVQQLSPAAAQTGPALRNDRTVMEKHLALLKGHPELKKIYRKLSKRIHTAGKK